MMTNLLDIPELIGQDRVREYMETTLKTERIPHAVIISGPRGSGKLCIAKAFAKAVLKTDSDTHLDIRYIDLYSNVKNSYVKTIREDVVDTVFIEPYKGDKKIYIIIGAGKMPQEAQNALLKSLEEPPEYVSMIMLTDDPGKLLPTIRSRSTKLFMKPVEKQVIESFLVSRSIPEDKAKFAAGMSLGILNKAISIAEDGDYPVFAEEAITVVSRIADKTGAPSDFQKEIKSFTEDIDKFLELMEIFIRDVLVYKLSNGKNSENIILPWKNSIKNMANRCSYEHLGRIRGRVANTREAIIANVSKDLLMNLFIIEVGGNIENTGRGAI